MRLLFLFFFYTLAAGVPAQAALQSAHAFPYSRAAAKNQQGWVPSEEAPPQNNDTLRLPSFFADFMVLQRENATVWGWANIGAEVQLTVSVENERSSPAQHGATTAAAAASLMTLFNSTTHADNVTGQFFFQVVGVPSQLNTTVVVRSVLSSTTIRNVAWGDVFLCSGQVRSRMNG